MKRPRSLRWKMFFAILASSLIPLLLCSAMLVQIFRLRLASDGEKNAREDLDHVLQALDSACTGFDRAIQTLSQSSLVGDALAGGKAGSTQVYSRLFDSTDGLRDYARFALYDADGAQCYSTRSAAGQSRLPTGWGALAAAARTGGLVFTASEDPADTSTPLLRGAAPLYGRDGALAGYLVIDLYQGDLRALLDGTYGLQNELLLLSEYWRPVYCTQTEQAAALAGRLRAQLLNGGSLNNASEDFLFSVDRHSATGLYVVLERPQVFNQGTRSLLYTVSLSSALVCVLISILLSFRLSRQLFRPIERLRRGMGQVAANELDVYVQPESEDELGELARRFNGMVADLRRNQEALVENQRELNEAQIRMLQAQLNPHFLCNTLDTMKWISKINQVPQVAVMATDLADILRFCISPEEFVPLRREAELLERYIEIQRIRMSGAFAFRLDIPEELADCQVPKMMLQPIVENAILHGLEGAENGEIVLTARESPAGTLRITVADNGSGLPPELIGPYCRQDEQRARGHLGLYNVDTILRKYYGAGCGLYLDNLPGGAGAVVTAALPLERKEDASC